MYTSAIPQAPKVKIAVMSMIAAGLLFQTNQVHAWCGPQWAVDAYGSTSLLLTDASEDFSAQADASEADGDLEEAKALNQQALDTITAAVALQLAILSYEGECDTVDAEEDPESEEEIAIALPDEVIVSMTGNQGDIEAESPATFP